MTFDNKQIGESNIQAVLSVKGITKIMGKQKLVNQLSFDMHQGEIVGLLGPNGAGKTTTIRMIVGLIAMNEGDVLVKGHSIRTDFAKAISHVGGIIENPEFYPYMTGYDNLKQYKRMGEGITEERISEVVKLVGLEGAMSKRVKAYSLGMRQRLGIAQALLHKPAILILDEPTNGLDPAGIREMRDYLKKIASEEGISILVSSHLLAEMELMCNRVVVIQEGKLVTVRTLGAANIENNGVDAVHGTNRSNIVQINLRVNDVVQTKDSLLHLKDIRIVGISPEKNDITVAIDDSSIPLLVNTLCEKGIALYRMEEVKESLEDEFLKWTGGNQIA
ncbi:putative ABC transporter ATP-binding protein YxlF [compost metagenome]